MRVYIKAAIAAACLLAIFACALALPGCGGIRTNAGSQPVKGSVDSQAGVGGMNSSAERTAPQIEGVKGKTAEEQSAATEGVHCASDANPGSTFKVKDIVVDSGWARVAVEESGVPSDEAMAYQVFLRKVGSKWDMVTSGADVTREDLPNAPAAIFKSQSK